MKLTQNNKDIHDIDTGLLRIIASLMIAEKMLEKTKHKALHEAIKTVLTHAKETSIIFDRRKNDFIDKKE